MPLNVLAGRHPVAELADLGVRRVSTGSLLFRRAVGAAVDAALAVRSGSEAGPAPDYATAQGWSAGP